MATIETRQTPEPDVVAAHFGVFGQYGFTLLQNGGELVGHQAISH
jgi:hypothetical protein